METRRAQLLHQLHERLGLVSRDPLKRGFGLLVAGWPRAGTPFGQQRPILRHRPTSLSAPSGAPSVTDGCRRVAPEARVDYRVNMRSHDGAALEAGAGARRALARGDLSFAVTLAAEALGTTLHRA